MSILSQETTLHLPEEVVTKVSQLAQVNRDSAAGFQEAADAIEDKTLASEFRVWAADRTRQADELDAIVEMNEGNPTDDRSWSAAMHQTWLKFRAAISDGDAYTVLAEAERGEDVIKEKYEEVLKPIFAKSASKTDPIPLFSIYLSFGIAIAISPFNNKSSRQNNIDLGDRHPSRKEGIRC